MSRDHLNHPSYQRTWVEVSLSAIKSNILNFAKLVGGVNKLMPAIKADAYGHGAIAVSRVALDTGCERLAVATAMEGEELRIAGINADIQILGASLPEEITLALQYDMILSIHEIKSAIIINKAAENLNKIARVHLKVDTGMGRLGILPKNILFAAKTIQSLKNLELEGLFMHLADASDESYSFKQLDNFNIAIEHLQSNDIYIPIKHATSSIGAILYEKTHFDLIRPGAGIYGFHSPTWVRDSFPLRAAMSWHCVVVQVKDYPPGLSLGYNRTFTTHRPMKVAVLPIGYADGYIREFSNHVDILINGKRAPIVGMISMDYTMADVTDIDDVETGTIVTLIGNDKNDKITVEELADKGETIPYTITTNLGRRPGRFYTVDEGDNINYLNQ